MKFFTSDTHFGHNNIIDYCKRPFHDIDDMNDQLIENINRVVSVTDELFHLGDFAFGGGKPGDFREKINCENIHLIMGNHDPHKNDGSPTDALAEWFASIRSMATVKLVADHGLTTAKAHLCHYPIESWRGKNNGYIHLHGHTHGLLDSGGIWRMDIGVDGSVTHRRHRDATDYRPYSEQEIITKITQKGIV